MGIIHDQLRARQGLKPRTGNDQIIPSQDIKRNRKREPDPHIDAPVVEATEITGVVPDNKEVVPLELIEDAIRVLKSATPLAEMAGMDKSYMSKVRHGIKPPPQKLIEAAKKVLQNGQGSPRTAGGA